MNTIKKRRILPVRSRAIIAIIAIVTSMAVSSLDAANAADIATPPDAVRFGEHIRPIFASHCVACHGGVKQAGDVSFVYRDRVLPPHGRVVKPGDPDASLLIKRVTADNPDVRMPPADHGPPLSAREIDLLTMWIRQGARWEEHWAYVPPTAQVRPKVSDSYWSRLPMDDFVLARLEDQGIAPAPDATPQRWLRRVTLDLIGLPPTVDERADFLADLDEIGESAYERVAERLLQSHHYGERWASVWLDQVRYADSKGLGMDARRNVWKYRDWVIDALNRDLPYDEFSVKQIAGDLLPEPTIEDKIATAAHRVTQTNEEGGTDDEEFRVAAVLDRVNTTWQAWQGVTFGCVQCHDHPYDPFGNEEYYKFVAFFNNTADCDLDEDWPILQAPLDVADYLKAAQLDRQIDDLRNEIWQQEFALLSDEQAWQPLVGITAFSNNATKIAIDRKGNHDEFHTVGTLASNADITVESPLPDKLDQLTAIRFTAMPLNPKKAVADSEWGFVLSHVEVQLLLPAEDEPRDIPIARLIVDQPDGFYDPQASLNRRSRQGFAAYTQIHYPREAALLPESPVEVPPGARLRVTLKHRVFLLASFALVTRRGHLAVSSDVGFSELLTDKTVSEQRAQLAQWEKQRAQIKSASVPILRERPDRFSRPTHVFERGLFLTKGKRVDADVPKSLPPLPNNLPRNRLALAKWMVSPSNPLTARVAVNRVWSRLFGIGLVATEEDFGSSGEPPSHPRLLDHLATRFQHEQGWSMKQLLREVVLSRTYRQSAKIRHELYERDPQNRLLARGPRHRLPAELVRDQALAISGLLSPIMFGPPVHPPIPGGVWQPFQAGDKWRTAKPGDENRYRRSIYTYTKRSIPYPMFAAFDAPSREFCTPRRLRSNTPTQALMTLNDTTFAECAVALAHRMQRADEDPREQISFGFLAATCRQPRQPEINELLSLYETTTQGDPMTGLTTVAAALLNLDEVLAK